MPIQFIFGWSKALVAVLCSLLLMFVILCTQPFYQNDDQNIDRTNALSQYVINNVNRTYVNLTATNMQNASIIGVERSTSSDLPNMRRIKKFYLLNQTAKQQNHSSIEQTKHWRNSKKRDNEFDKRQRLGHTSNIDPIIIDLQSSRIINMTKLNSDAPLFNSSVRFTQQLHQSNATSPSALIATALASTITIYPTLSTEFETHTNDFNESQMDHMHNMNCSQSNGEDTELILSRTERSTPMEMSHRKRKRVQRNHQTNLFEKRIERSANLSLSKATKRIQLLIKGRFLQMLPNGVVNGTHEDASEYSEYKLNIRRNTTVKYINY